ncbi:CPBP family intramembrane glutamic endopeptidase [Gilvimarinus algae]|uniref:Type II CAAX endopeptidase family protein n=1 Tax=Gilvimarinus algae TaxID=3058037 RepID=A0ABT8TAJ9_9GAMM|nr:type II CAAX endopeptidase family protein [Gilvimarinus sp. SDUM040014]MDO3380604.1 type II CAAX endopeptidase family protein [Gilvimarinus sp. SDUM040014]
MTNTRSTSTQGTIRGLERPGDDFPFHAHQTVTLSVSQWLIVLAAVGAGFACLTVNVPVLTGDFGLLIRTLLFPLVPLVTLRVVAGRHWLGLFRRVRGADVGLMLGFALLNLLVSSLVGLLVMSLYGADLNLAVQALASQSTAEREWFFLRSLPQLFGEEILTVLPFLAVLYVAHDRLNFTRTQSVLLAWLISSVLFGLVHLPTYNWNLIQCLLVIGSARLVLSLAYIRTKNIWVSTGAHIINDWTIFGIVLLSSPS